MCKSLENKALLIFILGIATNIITFIIIMIFNVKSINIYGAGMVLPQRLPPSSFTSDKKLLNFLLHIKESKSESEMPTAQGVIFMSHDAIVCTNGSGVIEIINPAAADKLGYTPEQMLGQNISSFFASCDIPIQSNNDKKETTNNENNENNNEMLNNSDSEKNKKTT